MLREKTHLTIGVRLFVVFLLLLLVIFIDLSPVSAAPEDGPGLLDEDKSIFDLKGQFKELFVYLPVDVYSQTGREKKLVSDLKRLRLSPELSLSDVLIVHMDYDNEIISGSYLKSPVFDAFWRPSDHNDLIHMSWEPYYNEDLYYRTKIHRAYAKIVLPKITITLGRQQIRFGSGRLWNPLDIMNPISPLNLEGGEEQKGVDALRAEYYLTPTTEMGLILEQKRVNNEDRVDSLSAENTNYLARIKTALGETEIAAMAGRIARRYTTGLDISTIVLDGMLRGSILYQNPDEGPYYLLSSVGYEYNFSMGLYFLMEYFYNQRSINNDSSLKEAYLQSLVQGIDEDNYYVLSNRFITFNRHYLSNELGYDITPLLRGEFFTIYDIEGRAFFFNPSLKYNAFQNIDVFLGIMCAETIKGGEESDFDQFEDNRLVYAYLAWYF